MSTARGRPLTAVLLWLAIVAVVPARGQGLSPDATRQIRDQLVTEAQDFAELDPARRRAIMIDSAESLLAEALGIPGADANALTQAQKTQAATLVDSVLGQPPPTPTPAPTPGPAPGPTPAPAPVHSVVSPTHPVVTPVVVSPVVYVVRPAYVVPISQPVHPFARPWLVPRRPALCW